MKYFKYLLAIAIFSLSFVSCDIVREDAFSTAPVAPEMYAHGDIIMTSNTMDEEVNFSWKPSRFIGNDKYDFFAVYGKDTVLINSSENLFYKIGKNEFKSLIYSKFKDLPVNDTFEMSFFASATDNNGAIHKAKPTFINVYAYGDAVSPVPSSDSTKLILDITDPDKLIGLLKWEPARLTYGEEVTYTVRITLKKTVTLAGQSFVVDTAVYSGIKEQKFVLKSDKLNDDVLSIGASINTPTNIAISVVAYCPSYPKGIPSKDVVIPITPYTNIFNDEIYVITNSTNHSIKQSSIQKGYYEGMARLMFSNSQQTSIWISQVSDGATRFFYKKVSEKKYDGTNTVIEAKDTTSETVGYSVPSKLFNVSIDVKRQSLKMVEITSLSLIGEAFDGWDKDVDLKYDPEMNTFSLETNKFISGKEFKIRANHNWDYAFGGSFDGVSFTQSTNLVAPTNNGKSLYRIVLNCNTTPYKVSFIDLNMPDKLIVAGNYSGHSWNGEKDAPVNLVDADKGIYKGYISMFNSNNIEFKFVKNSQIDGKNVQTWIGGTPKESQDGVTNFDLKIGGGDNMKLTDGTYYWLVDMINNTAKAVLLQDSKTGIIGSFEGSSWGKTIPMTFDKSKYEFSITYKFKEGDEFKFRFNDDWAYNLGCKKGTQNLSILNHDGDNYKIMSTGSYKITLNLANDPKATVELVPPEVM